MRQVRRGREVASFTKDFTEKSAMLFPHSVATKEYIADDGILVSFL